jgi:hypothetical protein
MIESLEATVVEWWLDTGGVSSADVRDHHFILVDADYHLAGHL